MLELELEPLDTCTEISYIYVLMDPRTKETRYVGQSRKPEERYRQHLQDRNDSAKTRWITSLRLEGTYPLLGISYLVPVENANRMEAETIEWLSKTERLTNREVVGTNRDFYPPETPDGIRDRRIQFLEQRVECLVHRLNELERDPAVIRPAI